MIPNRDARIERLAQIGGDGEHKQGVRADRLEFRGLAHRGVGRRPRESRDDGQIGHVPHNLQDPDLLLVREVRAFAGVDVDGQCDRTLLRDPRYVGTESALVDAAIGVHRQDRGRDQASQIQCHASSGLSDVR